MLKHSILQCPTCGTRNKIPDPLPSGACRCGHCGKTIDLLNIEYQRRRELVFRKIELWKKRLLDLTRRNRLLFFTPSRTATVQITSPAQQDVFQRLVNDGRTLTFPVPRRERQLLLQGMEATGSRVPVQEDFRPGDLETSSPVGELQSKLYRLRRSWKTFREEQGVHTLFLTLGMLHWQESNYQQEECLAPLILIPVGLEKKGLEKPYSIEFADEDIVINPVLAHKLETDYGIHMPKLPDEEYGWSQVNQILEDLVKPQRMPDGWDITDELWLGIFSFEKFVMYRDLEEHKEKAATHPIIAGLSSAQTIPEPIEIPGIDDSDTSVDPKEVFPVLDADSSQLEVLLRARAGQNLVVQGPPGTGKSQTIVNLIAQALRDGKRVLFVSEKMAALEVVFRRLEKVGLSFACLEIHSHRSNKAKVIEELGRTLRQCLPSQAPSAAMDRFNRLKRLRELLNQYVRELHKPRGSLLLTAYSAHGRLAKCLSAPVIDFDIPLEQVMDLTPDRLDTWLDTVSNLATIQQVWDEYAGHPWGGADIDLASYNMERRDQLLSMVGKLRSDAQSIKTLTSTLADRLGLKSPQCFGHCEKFLEILAILNDCVPIAEAWLRKDPPALREYIEQANEGREHASRLTKAVETLKACFKDSLLILPVDSILARFRGPYRTILRWAKQEYWQDIKMLKAHWVPDRRTSYRAGLEGLEAATMICSERIWFGENESRMSEAFGNFYKGPVSNWDAVESGVKWAERLITVLSGAPPLELCQLALCEEDLRAAVEQPLTELGNLLKSAEKPHEELRRIYQNDEIHRLELQEGSFDVLSSWLDRKKDPRDLDNWVNFLRARAACNEVGLEGFVKAALGAGVKTRELEGAFLKRLWKAWISEAHQAAPSLNEFRWRRHEDIINDFRVLDQELKQVATTLVQNEVQKRQDGPETVVGRAGQQHDILNREVQKKKRHRPLRRLFAEIPDLLQALKPCLLMSPLSVAAYLGNSTCRFDLVIFDEASQVPPEDGIGAILRGAQLIVAGDNKQLPPTRFFQVDMDQVENEETPDEAPLESILDECIALRGFSSRLLNWHYRSRYEELIAFSNRYFYGSRLVTFPSPYARGSSGAVRFIHVPEAVYDRGGSRTNRIEAQKVSNLVADHLRNGRKGSVGVITLSFPQEEAVLQEWERRKAAEPDLATLVNEEGDEPFFIKALERVQGDERDFIFVSIGYGPDRDRVMHLNFGPINQAGGERRLNVLVTRARFQTAVVCSMLPHELDLTRLTTKHEGVVNLQKYLEYAKNGGTFPEKAGLTGMPPDSDFEIAVKEAVEARDYQVDSQVGVSGFRIDLGIRHPDFPTRYILGIECDGAPYHSHRTARDRDRLRQEVLNNLGWQIHRIWSTDWVRDPATMLDMVIQRINELRARGESGVST